VLGLPSAQELAILACGLLLSLIAAGAFGFHLGTRVQTGKDAAAIAKKDHALLAAAESLRAAGRAIEDVNVEAARWQGEAARAEKRASIAVDLAAAAANRLHDNDAERAAAERAARGRPGCAALLDMDVAAQLRQCGVLAQ
jgi:hypothetical protein